MTSTLFLEKALVTLEEALEEYSKNPEHLLSRDGVIQRFEYCYELSVKTLGRVLRQEMESSNELEIIFYKDLIRIAAQKGLITSPKAWFKYRDVRNKTSHTYDEKIAEEVFESIKPFLISAKDLLNKLKKIESKRQ